jgi:hypothetical protein
MKYINQKLVLAILPLFVGIAACGVTHAGARLHRVQYTVLNRFSKFQIQP